MTSEPDEAPKSVYSPSAQHPRKPPDPERDHAMAVTELGHEAARSTEAVLDAEFAEAIARGRAAFRARYEAYRRQQAHHPANEAAARGLVGQWDEAVAAFKAALPRLNVDPTYGPAREVLLRFGQAVREQPGAVTVLRERGEAFGMRERPNLARVLADARPEMAVGGIVEAAEAAMQARLQEQAGQLRTCDFNLARLSRRVS